MGGAVARRPFVRPEPEQRDQFIKLELDWPVGLLDRLVKVLEVSCGSGFEPMSLDRVTVGEIIGIDLNLGLLRNGATRRNGRS
jgi:hypothetical protein